jgi:hypothetical protein
MFREQLAIDSDPELAAKPTGLLGDLCGEAESSQSQSAHDSGSGALCE